MTRDKTAIVGIGTTEYARNIGRSEQETALEAIRDALDDAGLKPRDVDAIFKVEGDSNHEFALARNLGAPNLRMWGAAEMGGGGAQAPVVHAVLAVASGMASVAVAFKARNRGSGGRPWASRGGRIGDAAAFEYPYGLVSPVQQIAVLARRYMHDFGASPEHFARVCVTQRENATRNPRAVFRSPITVEDVLNSRLVADPLHLLDCCPEIDGACAVVVTSAARARELRRPPVLVSGVAHGTGNAHFAMTSFYKDDVWDLPARYAAHDVYAMAGVGPNDVDVALLYDVFSPLVLFQLEAYGFCHRGEAAAFVEHGCIDWPSGSLPVNTHGGSLSEAYIHGHNHTLEAVRQLRGTSTSQVKDASVALVAAAPMVPTSALILRRG
ncbi:MAG: lipid-transfer protein [Dehalococcoidia bacterium]